jgi:hypothetical protein
MGGKWLEQLCSSRWSKQLFVYLLTAGAVAAVTTAAGTDILTDDLQIVVFLNHPTYHN